MCGFDAEVLLLSIRAAKEEMLLHYKLIAWEVYGILACATYFPLAKGAEIRQCLMILDESLRLKGFVAFR